MLGWMTNNKFELNGGEDVSNQTVIGGFTVTFDGVTPVSGGYQWSYTITNDGTEKDLSNWVLQLKNCVETLGKIPCSLGMCELVKQECPEDSEDCETFRGVKFDNLPSNKPTQTFTFILPDPAVPTVGCFYLKYGTKRVCGEILVPDCAQDPPCPPCPTSSIRDGKTFTYQVEHPVSTCEIDFQREERPEFYLCTNGLKLDEGVCDLPTEVTLCENTDSEQTISCLVPLDYLQISGKLQIIWQLRGELDTLCAQESVSLKLLAVTDVDVTEICYFCDGERPDFNPDDVCDWFYVRFVSLSETGLLTYTVTFLGCDHSHDE